MADLNIHIRVSQGMMRWGLTALLLTATGTELASESVTLSTYYPAPSGIYGQLITTGNTVLARSGANTTIGGPLAITGSVTMGGDFSVVGDGSVGRDATIGRDASIGRDAFLGRNISVPGHVRLTAVCAQTVYTFTGYTPCPGGTYATYTPGVFANDILGPAAAAGSTSNGAMYCCGR